MTYFAVDDDDLTIITGMEICTQDGVFGLVPREHFRGFRPEIFSPTSGTQYQTFGIMDAPDPFDKCFYLPIDEEIMYFTVYFDLNDVEGIVFEGYEGTEFVYRANGEDPSPRERLGGRPIGFRAWQGDGGIDDQVLLISIVYNACNCPASEFIMTGNPSDMSIQAVVGVPVDQSLTYQENYMETIYGQDCGSYSITFTPELALLGLTVSGAGLSPLGVPFIDLLTLTSNSIDDIGVYNLKMNIGQDIGDASHGFDQPYRGIVAE